MSQGNAGRATGRENGMSRHDEIGRLDRVADELMEGLTENGAGEGRGLDADDRALIWNTISQERHEAASRLLSAGSALAEAMKGLDARDPQRGPEWHTGCGTRSPLCFLCEARAALTAWEEATGASLRDENLTTKTKGD
jgi:hypothetical protein